MSKTFRIVKDLLWHPMSVFLSFIFALVGALGNYDTIATYMPQLKELGERLGIGESISQLFSLAWHNWVPLLFCMLWLATFYGAYRKLHRYYWGKAEINLHPELVPVPQGQHTHFWAFLTVSNQEESEITDCFATLESTTGYYDQSSNLRQISPHSRYLRWLQDQPHVLSVSASPVKVTIPPKSQNMKIRLAYIDNTRGVDFVCEPRDRTRAVLGRCRVCIRVDGKLKDDDIEPRYFFGDIFVSEQDGQTQMRFEENAPTKKIPIPQLIFDDLKEVVTSRKNESAKTPRKIIRRASKPSHEKDKK